MKILFCKFEGFGEDTIAKTLLKMGYEVAFFDEETDNHDYDRAYLDAFAKKMEEEQPGLVFSINFLPIISKVCQIYTTLYISWLYDSPEIHLYSSALTNSVNRIFTFDKIQYNRFHEISPQTVFYMPLATRPMTEQEITDISEQERADFGHDICFIGSLYDESDRKYYALETLPPYWKGFVEALISAQLNVFGYNFIADALSDHDVAELKKHLKYVLVEDYRNVDREIVADMYIGPLVSARDRVRTIEYLAEERKVTLYSRSDWKGIGNVEHRGTADIRSMTPKIFHCSKINLNITSKTIQSGIPLRVFDVLGCGGFLITNYQTELYDYFEPGEDLVVYESLEDLREKVAYYLEHGEERERIAKNGYRKVCENFTYEMALREMLHIAGI